MVWLNPGETGRQISLETIQEADAKGKWRLPTKFRSELCGQNPIEAF
jgi:hypothetical protein